MFLIFVFLLGLIFGSFANVLIYRIPQGLSLWDRSYCPKCKKKISWFDNVPLLSFFLLRGRCRKCRGKISKQYPLVELITGLIFVLLYFFFPLSKFIYLAAISVVLISIFVIDLKHCIIPDGLVIGGIVIFILFFLLVPSAYSLVPSFLAGAIAALFLWLLHFVTKGKGMGLGDVKFAFLGGMVAGLSHLFTWLTLSFLIGAAVGVILIVGKKAKLKSKIAFGPFLVLALFLVIFWYGT